MNTKFVHEFLTYTKYDKYNLIKKFFLNLFFYKINFYNNFLLY